MNGASKPSARRYGFPVKPGSTLPPGKPWESYGAGLLITNTRELRRLSAARDRAEALAQRRAYEAERRATKAERRQASALESALAHDSWRFVTRRGVEGLEQLVEHVPWEVRRIIFGAPVDRDPIYPILQSIRRLGGDSRTATVGRRRASSDEEGEFTLGLIGVCYGLSRERIRQIQVEVIGMLRKNKRIIEIHANLADD
jgi:hypothetical protein